MFAPLAAGQRVTAGTLNGLLLAGVTAFYAECTTAPVIQSRSTELIGDAVPWDNPPVTDILGAWSAANPTRWTCTVAGRWNLAGSIGFNANAGGTLREAIWYKNGTLLAGGRTVAVAVTSGTIAATALTAEARALALTLSVGDYLEMVPLQNSTQNVSLAGGSLRSFISMTYAGLP